MTGYPQDHTFESALRASLPNMPREVRFRLQNALDHFDKAIALLPHDREMASFRAITGEEEAASGLLKSLQLRGYPRADLLNIQWHHHKAALSILVAAVTFAVGNTIPTLTIDIDTAAPRLDVTFALNDLGVSFPGAEKFALMPVEPLDLISRLAPRDGGPETPNLFEAELRVVAADRGCQHPSQLVRKTANQRNTLLYASDTGLPKSSATEKDLRVRKHRGVALGLLSIAVLQTERHQALVVQGIEALLAILPRPPRAG